MTRRIAVLITVALIAAALAALGLGVAAGQDDPAAQVQGAPSPTRATAQIVPVGPTLTGDGADQITATVKFLDADGRGLFVTGGGRGFRADQQYLSFIYGDGSVPTGPTACVPPAPNNLTFPQMLIGQWLPFGSTRRTLVQVHRGPYARLAAFDQGTASVRRFDPVAGNQTRIDLQSCAAVVVRP